MAREITLPIKVRELSRSTGLSASQISRIFAGKSIPSLQAAVSIAYHLNVSVDCLVTHLQINP